jgi:hypothetical protein
MALKLFLKKPFQTKKPQKNVPSRTSMRARPGVMGSVALLRRAMLPKYRAHATRRPLFFFARAMKLPTFRAPTALHPTARRCPCLPPPAAPPRPARCLAVSPSRGVVSWLGYLGGRLVESKGRPRMAALTAKMSAGARSSSSRGKHSSAEIWSHESQPMIGNILIAPHL